MSNSFGSSSPCGSFSEKHLFYTDRTVIEGVPQGAPSITYTAIQHRQGLEGERSENVPVETLSARAQMIL